MRFAMGIISCCWFLLLPYAMRDLYTIEFGAEPILIATAWVVINIFAPPANIFLGLVMSKYGAMKGLGRFGSWFIGGMVVGCISGFMLWFNVYLPDRKYVL